ncbi:hypothetical protein M2351_006125 [Azospirillum canadense]|nr:hypothetical protein [Azospirillum canadense]
MMYVHALALGAGLLCLAASVGAASAHMGAATAITAIPVA